MKHGKDICNMQGEVKQAYFEVLACITAFKVNKPQGVYYLYAIRDLEIAYKDWQQSLGFGSEFFADEPDAFFTIKEYTFLSELRGDIAEHILEIPHGDDFAHSKKYENR